jgi:hypothetical protein
MTTEENFPYQYKLYLSLDQMYENLKKYYPSTISYDGCDFGLIVRTFPHDYYSTDSISVHFTERERMRASVANNPSPMSVWLKSEFKPATKELRDSFFKYEANLFNPTISINLIKRFEIKTILDPCMGWGDRLIAALICEVDLYSGYDTNPALKPKYEEIFAKFNKKTEFSCKTQRFELAEIDYAFDAVLTSPPFFTIELYEGADTSTNVFKTRTEWEKGFYIPFLRKSYDAVKQDGFIMLYITQEMFEIAKTVLKHYIGCLGFYQKNGPEIKASKIRKTYIFQKL